MRQLGLLHTNLPDVIIGDLDSLRPEVRAHYDGHGVEILHVPSQTTTDFGKALRLIKERRKEIVRKGRGRERVGQEEATREQAGENEDEDEILDVVVMGSIGGRLDQGISQLHHLYAVASNTDPTQPYHQTGRIYLVSESSLSFFVPPGQNYIYTSPKRTIPPPPLPPRTPREEEKGGEPIQHPTLPLLPTWPRDHPYFNECCAVLPLVRPVRLTTHGFQWDVEDWESGFGGQLSTSNHIRSDVLQVGTDWWSLFTVELADGLKLWRE
ncbi:hypothetical protein KEM55_000469 [Ascosphaera atra]|nr:hypothetical protein KEM55_000469 [Ascosphaera atra]